MKTTEPTTPRMSDTGISNGMMIVRPMRSQIVTMAIPSRHTQGRLLRRSSPRNIETMLGTISEEREGTHHDCHHSGGDSDEAGSQENDAVVVQADVGGHVLAETGDGEPVGDDEHHNRDDRDDPEDFVLALMIDVKLPANQMPRLWSLSVARAMYVVMEPTTAPSMMPTIGTISDDDSCTRRRKRKKIIVPTNAATIALIIRGMSRRWERRSGRATDPAPPTRSCRWWSVRRIGSG